ncbi:MAG: MurR/RpiR family transcriptional regulator [Oscillospiraceae bacterium]|nr:MurR/RpiR family transcriptional regulator [Oscillospiraceae bacterium]
MSYWKLPIVFLSEIVSSRADSTTGHIASYILGHMDELQECSLRELAGKVNVSASSLSRFCRDIGLRDFNELKELSADRDHQYLLQSASDNSSIIKDNFITAVENSLQNVRASVDMEKIIRLCCDIQKYEHVAVFGVLKSEGVAMNLQADLVLQGKHVVTKLPYSEQLDYLEAADEKNLIIIFSFKGVYYDYGFPMFTKTPKNKKPKIYFITSDSSAETSNYYDEVIWFQSNQQPSSHPYQLQLIADLIAQQYGHQLLRQK